MPGEQHLHGKLFARRDARNQHVIGGVRSRFAVLAFAVHAGNRSALLIAPL